MNFKVGDGIKIKFCGIDKFNNQTGIVIDISEDNNPIVFFDDKELNDSDRDYGAWWFFKEYVKLYTMDQTKRNLLDE